MNCPLHLKLGFSQCDVAKMILLELGIPTPLFCDNAKTKKPRFLKIQLRFYAYFPRYHPPCMQRVSSYRYMYYQHYFSTSMLTLESYIFQKLSVQTPYFTSISNCFLQNTIGSLMQLLLFVAGFGTLVAVNIELSANCLQLNWYLVYLSVQKVLVDTSQYDLLESKHGMIFAENLCITSADSDNFRICRN